MHRIVIDILQCTQVNIEHPVCFVNFLSLILYAFQEVVLTNCFPIVNEQFIY